MCKESGEKRKNLKKCVAYLQEPRNRLRRVGGRALDLVVAAGLIPAAFGSDIASGALLASVCTVPGQLPLEPSRLLQPP
jgi:hypothetical protein